MKLRRLIALVTLVLLALMIPLPIHAQTKSANFTYRKDFDSSTVTYCKLVGGSDNVWSPVSPFTGTGRIKTTGSSVDVDAVTAGQLPFANPGVDDVIFVPRQPSGGDRRVIATKTDGDNISVDTAVNWDVAAGFQFNWLNDLCGTTDADGWIDVSGYWTRTLYFVIEQISVTSGGIDMKIECKGSGIGAVPQPLWPANATSTCDPGTNAFPYCNFTAAGLATGRPSFVIGPEVACEQMRVGVALSGDNADANEGEKERVTIYLNMARGN